MRRPFYIIIQYLNFERSFIVSKQMVADATQSGDKRNAFCQSFHESSIKLTEFWNDLPRSELGSNHPGFQHVSTLLNSHIISILFPETKVERLCGGLDCHHHQQPGTCRQGRRGPTRTKFFNLILLILRQSEV